MASSLRAIAAGLQIPEFLLSGDMRGVNQSSARTALVQFRQHLDMIRHTVLVPLIHAPIWRRWYALEALRGTFPMGDAPEVEWHFPAQPWVDPLKDAEATALLIDRGLISRRMAVAALGYSWTHSTKRSQQTGPERPPLACPFRRSLWSPACTKGGRRCLGECIGGHGSPNRRNPSG